MCCACSLVDSDGWLLASRWRILAIRGCVFFLDGIGLGRLAVVIGVCFCLDISPSEMGTIFCVFSPSEMAGFDGLGGVHIIGGLYVRLRISAILCRASRKFLFFGSCEVNLPSNKFTKSVILSKSFSSRLYSGIGVTVGMIEMVSEILVECVFGMQHFIHL